METEELEAMNDILSHGNTANTEENNQENTQVNEENIQQNSEVQTEENEQEFDINSLDLSHLGITQSNEENTQVNEQSNQNNDNSSIQEIIKRLDSMQEQNSQDEGSNDEEIGALKELAEKLQNSGLIQGVSEEDRALMKEIKEFKEKQEQEEQIKQEQIEYENKVSALDSFSANLEKTVPGYDSKFMQKVVGDIVSTHPETAEKILNNPMELLTLWQQVGQKAQPSTTKTNVISSNSKTTADTGNNIEDKIKNGTASEQEEAMWLLKSFQ
jgi:hypothetical protein